MSSINSIKRAIKSDIEEIKELLNKENSSSEQKELHIKIDGKYQSQVDNWGQSMYGWIDNVGFSYELLGEESITHNLKTMQNKLEGYYQSFGLTLLNKTPSKTIKYNNSINNYNTATNNIQIDIDFKQIQETINNLESLTTEQTKEALEYLAELENIYKSNESRKSKWEKAKKVLFWVADKSVDVAIAYFPIIVKILTK